MTSTGATYSHDIQTLTGNAASSIALRNAIFKVIPKALIDRVYEKAVKYAVGDQKTLSTHRSKAFAWYRKRGVDHTKILKFFNKNNMEDLTLNELEKLQGIATFIKEGFVELDKAFVLDEETTPLQCGRACQEFIEQRNKKLILTAKPC